MIVTPDAFCACIVLDIFCFDVTLYANRVLVNLVDCIVFVTISIHVPA